MGVQIDTVDKRIIYRLTENARHTSAPDIAEEVDVSPPTIRNRIQRLEDTNVIKGYHAHIDYEQLDGRLTNLFLCTTKAIDRSRFAQRVLTVPGVINVREVMTGQEDLQITVVGNNTNDIRRMAQEISALGVEIEDEDLLHREHFQPYASFGPETEQNQSPITQVANLSGDANVVEVIVGDTASIVGKTLAEANERELLGDDLLVVSLTREDGETLTPDGSTEIRPGDQVTIFSRSPLSEDMVAVFTDS